MIPAWLLSDGTIRSAEINNLGNSAPANVKIWRASSYLFNLQLQPNGNVIPATVALGARLWRIFDELRVLHIFRPKRQPVVLEGCFCKRIRHHLDRNSPYFGTAPSSGPVLYYKNGRVYGVGIPSQSDLYCDHNRWWRIRPTRTLDGEYQLPWNPHSKSLYRYGSRIFCSQGYRILPGQSATLQISC